MNKDLDFIVHYYGLRHQCKKLNEEAYELCDIAIFLNEYRKNYPENYTAQGLMYENLISELADVIVMVRQIQEYFKVDTDAIVKESEYKVERQLKRIEKEIKKCTV